MKGTLMLMVSGICMSIFLQGCTTKLYKAGASTADFEQDMRICQYDATKYGYINSSYNGSGGYGAAIGAGVADGIAQGMRERQIIMECMALRGWSPTNKENSYSE